MPLSEVYNKNCMDGLKEYPDKYFNTILTDPPYGIDLEYNTYKDTEENWFELMKQFIPLAQSKAKMVIMPCCRIKALPWIYQNFPPDWIICWYKGSPGHRSFIGFNDWEPLLVYGKNDNVQMHDYFYMANDVTMGSFGHPCPKPIKWFKYLISRSMPDRVGITCDPFLGSATSRLAADNMNIDFIGFELDKDYFNEGCKRFDQYKSQLKLFA